MKMKKKEKQTEKPINRRLLKNTKKLQQLKGLDRTQSNKVVNKNIKKRIPENPKHL